MNPLRDRSWSILLQSVAAASRSALFLVSCFWLLAPPTAHAIVDTNDNGMSDLWEKQYNDGDLFPNNFDPQADPDGDGWTNEQEAAAGTDPRDANAPTGFLRPTITETPAVYTIGSNGELEIATPQAVTVTWPTIIGKRYTLFFSADLTGGSWIPVGAPFIGNGNEPEYGFEVNDADKCFWRVAINDLDSDEDGLTNHEEQQLGTDPHSADTDLDGVNDLAEIQQATDPHVPRIWGFTEMPESDGTVTYTWNSYAKSGDWFEIERLQPDTTWKTVYSTTYGSAKLPYEAGIVSYSLNLNPATDYLP